VKKNPRDFLEAAQKDAKLSDRITEAVEKGAKVTANEVMAIAKEAGYSFTRAEFERAVRQRYSERFAAGDVSLADVMARPRPRPPLSSCARGCLSYTKSWHPRGFQLKP
jgi:hypothetical protein